MLSLADLERHDQAAPNKRPNRRFLCPLPACKDTPQDADHRSFSVNVDNGAWNCKRCDAKGLLTDFFTDRPILPARQRQAAEREKAFSLSPRAPKAAPAVTTWSNVFAASKLTAPVRGTAGQRYLDSRGIPVDVAEAAGVRYALSWLDAGPSVVFPVTGENGDIVAAQGRAISGSKHRADGPKGQGVFLTAGALDADPVAVVEAPIDALSLAAYAMPSIALCGKSAPSWLAKRLAFKRVILAFDADDGGDQAAAALGPRLTSFGCTVERLIPVGAKDINAWLMLDPEGLRAQLEAILPQATESQIATSDTETLLTGDALADAMFAKLAAVTDVVRAELKEVLYWAGEPGRTPDELRAAGLPETFEGVVRWVLITSPLEVPRALMKANAYPDKYRFASDHEGEHDE